MPVKSHRKVSELVVPRPLQQVDLIAGEWNSSDFLKYCHADKLSVSALLDVVLADDPEDEQFGINGDLWRTS